MSDNDDTGIVIVMDVLSAHGHRDGKVIHTVLITQRAQPYWDYAILDERTGEQIGFAFTRPQAQAQADAYIKGYMKGYDHGHEAESQHRTDAEAARDFEQFRRWERAEQERIRRQPALRRFVRSGRKPAFEGERGSGADESGSGEGEGPSGWGLY